MDGAGQPALVAIIAGLAKTAKDSRPIGLGANAGNFLPFLERPPASGDSPDPGLD
jgi:hypothetical protein